MLLLFLFNGCRDILALNRFILNIPSRLFVEILANKILNARRPTIAPLPLFGHRPVCDPVATACPYAYP
ncbi:MAG: hypothetical protein P4L69_02865 [Desulfosporosinus sp.]|nr:hypothetical protein [Desulfosporosinus sp.]